VLPCREGGGAAGGGQEQPAEAAEIPGLQGAGRKKINAIIMMIKIIIKVVLSVQRRRGCC
jgi:hypothetical protein